MKKILSLALASCLALSLTACGGDTDVQSDEDANTAETFEYQKLIEYPEAKEITSQASFENLAYEEGKVPTIAFMPAGTEFPYIMAVGEGVKATAEEMGVNVVTIAPQSGSDINAQVGMMQDAITQGVDAILLNAHDDNAMGPVVKQATEAGILVFNINSDSMEFTADLHGVIGYSQFDGNVEQGQMLAENFKDQKLVIGIIEGLPGYHNNERTGGFIEGIKDHPDHEIVSSLNGEWNTDGGNTAAMDMLQANPEINMIYAANDMEAMGAMKACQTLDREDVIIVANDGNTEYLEEIYNGTVYSTLNTVPYEMGQFACQVVVDALYGEFPGGWCETPGYVTTADNVLDYLTEPEKLNPKPSKEYTKD